MRLFCSVFSVDAELSCFRDCVFAFVGGFGGILLDHCTARGS